MEARTKLTKNGLMKKEENEEEEDVGIGKAREDFNVAVERMQRALAKLDGLMLHRPSIVMARRLSVPPLRMGIIRSRNCCVSERICAGRNRKGELWRDFWQRKECCVRSRLESASTNAKRMSWRCSRQFRMRKLFARGAFSEEDFLPVSS